MRFAAGAIQQVEQRAGERKAPVYAYRFDWVSDVMHRRLRAFHSLEIAFTFDNTDRWDSATGGGARPRALASRMSGAWVGFARTGNPNHPGLPQWPPYGSEQKAVMIFDAVCAVKRDPDGKARQLLG